MAVVGLIVITRVIYLVALFAEFLAPDSARVRCIADYTYAPPQQLHLGRHCRVADRFGLLRQRLHVGGRSARPTLITYTVDPDQQIPVGLFVRGERYRLFGLIPGDVHLIGPVDSGQPFYLLGADRNGRDLLSRMIHGTRVSMSIGLIGVALAFAARRHCSAGSPAISAAGSTR